MDIPSRQPAGPSFFWPMSLVLVLSAVVLALMLRQNDLLFLALFDDAYILFEQARNILHGNYGHNPGEISAPCSSILWPFLLAPLTALPGLEWLVLVLNLGLVIATIRLQYAVIAPLFSELPARHRNRSGRIILYLLLTALMFSFNPILQVFSGMETALQVFLAHLTLLGLLSEGRTRQAPVYLWAALFFSPLIRYESLAVVCPVMIYLFRRGHRSAIAGTWLVMALALMLFSAFLHRHGIGLLPTSIVAKSIHQNGLANPLVTVGANFLLNLINPFSLPLILLCLGMAPALIAERYRPSRGLAAIMLCAGLLHLVFGHIGPLPLIRYEAYILSLLALSAARIYLPGRFQRLGQSPMPAAWALAPFGLLALPAMIITACVPAIANATYRHPYQMHRLATEFYPHPVAVNDLGWVSYKNSAYVLDLWGVGSAEALRCGRRPDSLACVARLAAEKDIHLVMVTNSWFRRLPETWVKIGAYYPGDNPRLLEPFVRGIVNYVDFYVANPQYLQDAVTAVEAFCRTLPPSAVFEFSPGMADAGPAVDR